MSKIIRFMLAVILPSVILLSGCSSSNHSTGTDNTVINKSGQSGAKVTLTLWSRTNTQLFERVIKDFEQDHPDIHIQFMKSPEAGEEKAIDVSAVTSGDLPDMFTGPTKETIEQLVMLGKVHNLDEVFPKTRYNQFTPGTFAEGLTMLGGSVYQFPLVSSLQGGLMMVYNKNVLDKLGIKESQIPQTWDGLLRVGKEIHQKSGGEIYALQFDGKTNGIDRNIIEQSAPVISPGYGLKGFDFTHGEYDYNLPGVKETFGFFKKAYDEKVLDPATLSAESGASLSSLKAGKVAFIFQGFGEVNSLQLNNMNDPLLSVDWGIAPIPTKNGKPSFMYFQGGSPEGLYVSEHTEHWAEVKMFLGFMEDDFAYREMIHLGSEMPAKRMDYIEISFPYSQYEKMTEIMSQSKVLAPNVYKRNSDMVDVLARYNRYKPSGNIGYVFLRFMSGQFDDLSQELQTLSENNNKALDRAVRESDGKVKREDFIFSDWIPGKPFEQD
jgi:raffinose/stachyose/melibiose transport system substrate-binding protein